VPLILPNLDDRTYADLAEEGRALIPTCAPEWTNHNPSDPGITLVELFAYLTEMLIYRLNRVTDANIETFLKLLNGRDWKHSNQKALTDEVRDTVNALRRSDRAVTSADFERLALEADPQVARARSVPRSNLDNDDPKQRAITRAGHMSVVIVPNDPGITGDPLNNLIQRVADFLDERRMITTRLHVVGPRYVRVGVKATLGLMPDATEDAVSQSAVTALQHFLDPISGGEDGEGWPFGRNVYVSEIFNLLDRVPGVDYVRDDNFKLTVDADQTGRLIYAQPNSQGDLIGVLINPDELVLAQIAVGDVQVQLPWAT